MISALIKLFKSSFFIQSEDHLKIWIFYCCKKWPTNTRIDQILFKPKIWADDLLGKTSDTDNWWIEFIASIDIVKLEVVLLLRCGSPGSWQLSDIIIGSHHIWSESNQLLNSNSASLQILSQILKYEMGREQFLENDKLSEVGLEN